MKFFEHILRSVEKVHLLLSRRLSAFFSLIWRLQSLRSLPFRLSVGFVGSALMSVWLAHLVSGGYVAMCEFDASFVRYLERAEHLSGGERLAWACVVSAILSILSAAFSFCRRRWVFRLMEISFALFAVTAALSFVWTLKVGSILNLADHKAFDAAARNEKWTGIMFWAIVSLPWIGALMLSVAHKAVSLAYGCNARPMLGGWGQRILHSLKTGGDDRRWRSSLYYALAMFFLVLFLPYMMFIWGWEEPYGLPKGGGQQVFEEVKVKKIKPKKKPKKLTVNPWSPYILERMDIDDVMTMQELEQETRDTYAAQQSVNKGGKGKGTGGWPAGMEGTNIRFIRLKYKGGDWDQDMGKGADYNLLVKFHEWTGMKIAKDTEFREISRLKFFPKKKSPPFVFMTGRGSISISESEAKTLRDYCQLEGGMLFIDNGGGHFDGAVKSMLRKVFPGKRLVDIPNDDPIYQRPYVFPDGAPPFWHHAGYRALGIRDEGRWMVFYHPGDVNDAWKDDHSGASPEVADQAYKLGVNIMFYAFNQYYRRHYEN